MGLRLTGFDTRSMFARIRKDEDDSWRDLRDVAEDAARFTVQMARSAVGWRTGDLYRAIDYRVVQRGRKNESIRVGVIHPVSPRGKSAWVERGTGVFGPAGMPIMARPGNVLAFEIDGRAVFAKSVRGQRGQHYMEKAIQLAERTYIPARMAALRAGNVG